MAHATQQSTTHPASSPDHRAQPAAGDPWLELLADYLEAKAVVAMVAGTEAERMRAQVTSLEEFIVQLPHRQPPPAWCSPVAMRYGELVRRAELGVDEALVIAALLALETDAAGPQPEAAPSVAALCARLGRSAGQLEPSLAVAMAPQGRLFAQGLLELGGHGDAAWLGRTVRLHEDVLRYLWLGLRPAPCHDDAVALAEVPVRSAHEMRLPDAEPALCELARAWDAAETSALLTLVAEDENGRCIARMFAARVRRPCRPTALLWLDLSAWEPRGRDPEAASGAAPRSLSSLMPALRDAARWALLHDAWLAVDATAVAPNGVAARAFERCLRGLDSHAQPTLYLATASALPQLGLAGWIGELPRCTQADRVAYARTLFGNSVAEAESFAQVVAHHALATLERAATCHASPRPLAETLAQLAPPGFGGLAKPVPTPHGLDALVLAEEPRQQLLELVDACRVRSRLWEAWGFASRQPYGRGITALLAGPPGTGKTAACGALAHHLGRPLYRVELAQLVSKYIGETEKQLARVFAEATASPCVLLFDEADALFARRTEVKSSNDRHGNELASYLLQALEQFDGIALLTTNHEQNLDPAFRRRIRYRVVMAAPDEAERAALWRTLTPPQVPLAADVDFGALARRYPLSGGHIQNALLRAATRALASEQALGQELLLESCQLEQAATGRL